MLLYWLNRLNYHDDKISLEKNLSRVTSCDANNLIYKLATKINWYAMFYMLKKFLKLRKKKTNKIFIRIKVLHKKKY